MYHCSALERLRDRKLMDEIGYIEIFMVWKDGSVKHYDSFSAAYHAAQQTGGIPIAGMLTKHDLYRITRPILLSNKALGRRLAKQRENK